MKRKSMWFGIMLVTVAVVTVVTAVVAMRRASNGATDDAGKTTFVVRRGELRQSVDSSGRVVSNLDVEIKCRASGEVIKLPFDISDVVKKGDLLLELDPSDQQRVVARTEITLAQSQARLAEAEAALAVAERDVVTGRQRAQAELASATARAKEARLKAERRKQLVEQQLGSSEDYEAADSLAAQTEAAVQTARAQLEEVDTRQMALETSRQQVALAKAQLESDRVSLADAKQQLEYTRVVAPMDGVISSRSVQVGAIISSGITNVGGGTTIMTLSDLSHIYVLASVDESDIGRVSVGQPVTITVDAYPDETFDGVVQRIATKGVAVSNVVTFEVKIEVTGANRAKLKPEMTANVQILTTKRDGVLLVPLTTVWRKDDKTVVTVRGADGASSTDRLVTLGISDGENIEVLDGVTEGQTVVTQNQIVSRWTNDQATTTQPAQQGDN